MKRSEEQKWKDEFARRLRWRLDELEMSQCELSRRIDIPQNSISTWCNGKVTPKAAVIPKLAKGLSMKVSDLIDFRL